MPDTGLRLLVGTKALTPESLPESAWQYVLGHPLGQEDLTAASAYSLVPWVYRAVDMRSVGLADMPWTITRGDAEVLDSDHWESVEGLEWTRSLRTLLLRTEQARCCYAASYWQRVGNVLGTKTLEYRWLVPPSIIPQYDVDRGLVAWTRKVGSRSLDLDLEDVVYTWLPSLTAELGPGPAPVQVALRAAGIVRNVDRFAEAFFARGALKATILQVPPSASAEDIKRLENWWKRLVRGVRGAFETVGLRTTVTPTVISSDPKDLAMTETVEAKQKDIAVAMGVPYSLLFSEASTYATAEQADLDFYSKCLLPECSLVEEDLNRQIFERQGYHFAFQPGRLELFEQRESKKSYALIAAVNSGVLTPNEWREKMDLPPLPGGDTLRAPRANPTFGSDASSQGQVAEDTGSRPPTDQVPAPPLRPAKALSEPAQLVAPDARTLDLDRWQRKAIKALRAGRSAAVDFVSDAIDERESDAILFALETATTAEEVRAAFSEPFRAGDDWPEERYP